MEADNLDVKLFESQFEQWKGLGDAGADSHYEFGRDTAYILPKVDGKPYVLRHVHLVPLNDRSELSIWNRAWNAVHKRERTSDRALAYVGNTSGQYLLIGILEDPGAHQVAKMLTAKDVAIMKGFAEVAAAFLWDGSDLTDEKSK